MAELAIKGHKTRGKEVIEILEMLGGRSILCTSCYYDTEMHYYIASSGYITAFSATDYIALDMTVFTVEKFLEKYPYKVGDKVLYHETIAIVRNMQWDGREIVYTVEYKDELWETTIFYLQPYKEQETMEEKKINQITLANCDLDEVEIALGDKFEIVLKNGKYYAVKKQPQYPKTYKECFRTCFGNKHHIIQVVGLDGLGGNKDLFENFIKLKICRDAYWKIAGEEIGLGKPWEPDLEGDQVQYYIFNYNNQVDTNSGDTENHILSFPTEEMRDTFYENFTELIELCKEVL